MLLAYIFVLKFITVFECELSISVLLPLLPLLTPLSISEQDFPLFPRIMCSYNLIQVQIFSNTHFYQHIEKNARHLLILSSMGLFYTWQLNSEFVQVEVFFLLENAIAGEINLIIDTTNLELTSKGHHD